MLQTAQSLHIAFLDGIKKSYTGTVHPSIFERIWNEWAQPEWMKNNVSSNEGVELNQKQIDDLAVLVNRWEFKGDNTNFYPLPDGVIAVDVINDINVEKVIIPKYYRALSVRFSLDYNTSIKQECMLEGISEFLKASYMRSDQRSSNYDSIYRKPKDSLLYWQRSRKNTIIDNPADVTTKIISSSVDCIQMLTDARTGSKSYAMSLEYLTYPNEISMSPDIPSVLSDYCKIEIIKDCVRLYLERVKDPRYQSFLMEQRLQNSNKV